MEVLTDDLAGEQPLLEDLLGIQFGPEFGQRKNESLCKASGGVFVRNKQIYQIFRNEGQTPGTWH